MAKAACAIVYVIMCLPHGILVDREAGERTLGTCLEAMRRNDGKSMAMYHGWSVCH